ncbi:cytochrome c [Brevundimonas sp.]|uniref:c-type cytochrome n=1 Tax=Brevundimonas sp. TaxID=1871086 RepID=UPI003562E6B8
MPRRWTAALGLVCIAMGAEGPQAAATKAHHPDERLAAVERGHRYLVHACSGCHAIGPAGASPLPDATPLRAGFADGLVTSHPAMPSFTFRAGEIDDLMAYLDDLRARTP